MSTDYGFECATCPDELNDHGERVIFDNCRDPRGLATILQHADDIVGLAARMSPDGLNELLTLRAGPILDRAVSYLSAHTGHELFVVDEYGQRWSAPEETTGPRR